MEIEKAKANRAVWSAAAVVVLVAALGLGFGIRKIRVWRAESNRRVAAEIQAKPASAEKVETEPIKEVAEVVEEEVVVVAEANESVEAEPQEPAKDDTQAEPPPAAPMQGPGMMGGGGEGWQQIWADLNLTEEEMARLREGWALAVERWQNMSEEERQVLGDRMRASWERWQNMSDEEREEASRELRARVEDWRRSGSTELPDLILD